MSCFTCLRSFVLLLFTFSHTGRTYLCVKAITNIVWLVDSHLDIFAPFLVGCSHAYSWCLCLSAFGSTVTTSRSGCRCILQCFFLLLKCIKLFVYLGDLHDWSCWFSNVLVAFAGGKVTLLPRLLVVGQLLRLVILVFEECLELHGEILLFIVGCWLLCDRYVWSYWFSLRLVWTAVISSIWSHACLWDLHG